MIELELSQKLLSRIVYEDLEFKKVIKEEFSKEEFAHISHQVTSLIGCVLRHYIFLTYLVKPFELSNDENSLLLVALANNLFVKSLKREDVITHVKSVLNDRYSPELDKLLTYEGSVADLHQSTSQKDNDKFVAMRFNVPHYLYKMWKKHFGTGITFKVLKRNIKVASQYLRVNTMKTMEDTFLNENKDFAKTDFEDIVIYNGKGNLRKTDAYKKYLVFNEKIAMKQAIDKVFTPDLEYVTLFSGADNASFRELYLRANKKVGLSVAVPSIDDRVDILRHIRLEKCSNVNLFEATDFTMMKAAITSPQDLIVLMPKSSSFDLIRLYPDYLLHFKQSSLDELIKVQKESLQEFSKFLVTDGLLLYMVDTMNKKESADVISDFLAKNPDFELVEHRQYFPFEKEDSTFYYAILKKVDRTAND